MKQAFILELNKRQKTDRTKIKKAILVLSFEWERRTNLASAVSTYNHEIHMK